MIGSYKNQLEIASSVEPDTGHPAYVLLVTGSRHAPLHPVWETLSGVKERNGVPFLLVHGGAPGADEHADSWAKTYGVPVLRMDALWDAEGNAAGPKRNVRMLGICCDLVTAQPDLGRQTVLRACAFPAPSGRGTQHMIRLLKAAKVPTFIRPVTT